MAVDVLISYEVGDSGYVTNVTNIINAECPNANVYTKQDTLSAAITEARNNSYEIVCRISDGLTDDVNDIDGDGAWTGSPSVGIVHVFGEDDTSKEFTEPSCIDIICSVTCENANYGDGLELLSGETGDNTRQKAAARITGVIAQIMEDNGSWNFHDARQSLRQTASNYSTGWVAATGFGEIDISAAKALTYANLDVMPPSRLTLSRSGLGLTFNWEDNWGTVSTETVVAMFYNDPDLTDTPLLAALYSGSAETFSYDLEATVGSWYFAVLSKDENDNYSRIESYTKFTSDYHDDLDFVETDSFIYHIKNDKWTKFYGLDVVRARNIHHGTKDKNLIMTSNNLLRKYQGDSYTVFETKVKSKKFYFELGTLRKFLIYLSGTATSVIVRIHNRKLAGAYSDFEVNQITDNDWHGISSGYYGDYIEFIVEGADEIEQILYDFSVKGGQSA